MYAFDEDRPARRGPTPARRGTRVIIALGGLILLGVGLVVALYNACKIDVGTGQQAVLIRREGLELEPDMELAPPPKDGQDLLQGRPVGRTQQRGPDRGPLLLQPLLLVVGDQSRNSSCPATRSASGSP